MPIPMTDYYADKDFETAFLEMKKEMERARALVAAQLAVAARSETEAAFQTRVREIAQETKGVLTSINSQMDAAIRGGIRQGLEMHVPNILTKYDEV